MLKQGIKAINAEFVWARALPKLSFAQFGPYATSFPGLLFSMVLMSKSKKTSGDVWTLRLHSRPPLTQGSRVLFRMWIICKFCCRNFIQKKYGRKNVCHAHVFSSLDYNFSFCTDFLLRWWLLKVKKRINKARSKHSKQFLSLYFLV